MDGLGSPMADEIARTTATIPISLLSLLTSQETARHSTGKAEHGSGAAGGGVGGGDGGEVAEEAVILECRKSFSSLLRRRGRNSDMPD